MYILIAKGFTYIFLLNYTVNFTQDEPNTSSKLKLNVSS